LTEAVNAYISGEENVGKAVLKDFINATVGFEKLSVLAEIPSKSLHRMLSPSGNPSSANFFTILRVLQEHVGIHLKVRAA
jgi:DNA-binding phage protein